MTLEYHDTMVPEHQYANIGNDTVKWDDGWFSDTVHARRFEGTLVEADVITVGEMHFGDNDKLYFGDVDDVSLYFDGSRFIADTTAFRIPPGGDMAVGATGALNGVFVVTGAVESVAASQYGVFSTVVYGSSGSGDMGSSVFGGFFRAETAATYDGNITGSLRGYYGAVDHYGSGTIDDAYGFYGLLNIKSGGGDITNGYGAFFAFTDASGSGEYTNCYGLYIYDVNLATTLNYAIYTNDGIVYFKDSVGIGVTPPDEKLQVAGNIHLNNNYESIYGTGKDAKIYYNNVDLVIEPDAVGTGAVKIVGDMYFSGAGSGLAYGSIRGYDQNATITITSSGVANKVQITAFAANGVSNLTTPDHTNDHITISKSGDYAVAVSITAESTGGSPYELGCSVWKNNGSTEFQGLHAHRELSGGGGDTASISLNDNITLAASDTLEVWCWNETNTNNIIIDDITLSIVQVGG